MSRANYFLSNVPEINYAILSEMDDETLFRTCNVNAFASEMCSDESFWRERTIKYFAPLIKYRGNLTWKIFYRRLVNDAMYTLETPYREVFVYSNTADAYDKFWSVVAGGLHITINEAQQLGFVNDALMCYIKLAFKGEVTPRDDEFIIYDSEHTSLDFLEYPDLPALNVKNRDLFFYAGSRYIEGRDPVTNEVDHNYDDYDETPYSDFRGVFDYSYEILHSFMSYTPPYHPDYPHIYDAIYWILRMDSGDSGTEYEKFKYGYVTAHTSPGDDVDPYIIIVLIDTSLFGSTAGLITEPLGTNFRDVNRSLIKIIENYVENKYSKMYIRSTSL